MFAIAEVAGHICASRRTVRVATRRVECWQSRSLVLATCLASDSFHRPGPAAPIAFMYCKAFGTETFSGHGRQGVANDEQTDGLNDVIARLRASKEARLDQEATAGFNAGVEWAKNDAEAFELEHLEALVEARGWAGFLANDSGIHSLADRITHALIPNTDGLSDSYQLIFGEDNLAEFYTADYVDQFAKGALSIWKKVKGLL